MFDDVNWFDTPAEDELVIPSDRGDTSGGDDD